jgi:rhodopsin domain-containing protein
MTESYCWGFGRHIYYLSPDELLQIRKYNIIATGPLLASAMFGRISFCHFLLNTIGTEKVVRKLLYTALASQALVNVIGVILSYGACGSHVTANWDRRIQASCMSFTAQIYYLYFLSGSLCSLW